MNNTTYILNHLYRIKDDDKRAFIISTDKAVKFNGFVEPDWVSILHPILAKVLLIFATPKKYEDIVDNVASSLSISKCDAYEIVNMLINNSDNFGLKYKGFTYRMPKNIIIKEQQQKINLYKYPSNIHFDILEPDVDLHTRRFIKSPLTLVFMVTNKCVTDCVYCYADKSKSISYMPFHVVERFIKEARSLAIKRISLDGGEVFRYPHWRELLKTLKNNDFEIDFISTKTPISKSDIDFLKDLDISIQVSLDSINAANLTTILKVNESYCSNILETIQNMDNAGIRFQIATVLTKYNCNIENMEALFHYLSSLKNLQGWQIRAAFRSLYSKMDFNHIKATPYMIKAVAEWTKSKQHESIRIEWNEVADNKYFSSKNGSQEFYGPRCSANFSNLFILPDGQVTICEQLYWYPQFIIGNLKKQTIEEIWKSDKAVALAYPKRDNFSDESACKKCAIFDSCMDFSNRCYADIIKAYGWKNSDFPDPRCIQAPPFKNELRSEIADL